MESNVILYKHVEVEVDVELSSFSLKFLVLYGGELSVSNPVHLTPSEKISR
jgi:hypothetical protein